MRPFAALAPFALTVASVSPPPYARGEGTAVVIPAAPGIAAPAPPRDEPFGISLADAYRTGADLVALAPPGPEELARVAAKEASAGCGADGVLRFGFVRDLDAADRERARRSWRPHELAPGDVLWTSALRSPGALGTRLRLEDVDLAGARLTLWAWDGETLVQHGPYTGSGPRGDGAFWTPSLPGDTAYLEVRGGSRAPELAATAVAHFDRLPGGTADAGGGNCPPAGDEHECQHDVSCASLQGGLAFARDATAQITFMKDGICGACTGTLLNDLDPTSQVLSFITAFHCVDSQAVADTLEAVWLYQTPFCDGPEPSWFAMDRNLGGTLLETSPDTGGNDMAFLRLDGDLQPGVAFAGFSSGKAAGILNGIHHPRGAPKCFASFTLESLFTCPFAYDPTDYDFVEASLGLVEQGSSGSGLFDNEGILFGQLSGFCCEAWLGVECEGATCDNQPDWRAAYGESEETWPKIQKWLETGGTLHVDQANTSPPYEGTPANPYPTISQALANAFAGVRLLVHAGSYDEAVTLDLALDTTGGTVVVGD